MALNGAVDAGPTGGVPLYRKAFFDSAFIAANADKLYMVEGLRSAIDDQARTSELLGLFAVQLLLTMLSKWPNV